MARKPRKIDSQTLFLTTSPRTPSKMIPEIALLDEHFRGQEWNSKTQAAFMEVLREENFFNGKGANDPAFSARDRINRAPKSLGFVRLSPTIELTPAGENLVKAKRTDEVFLRQMLKFQVPSPFHSPSQKAASFYIKPYLELIRLVRVMGTLKFDELQMFGMQLTDWREFDNIVHKIEAFRTARTKNKGNYKKFKALYLNNELTELYKVRISKGETKTRESQDTSLENFLKTQSGNMRDYADACFRYLRATGLINVAQEGKSLSVAPERIKDVDYILDTVDRNPRHFESEEEYYQYLGNPETPRLFTDNLDNLLSKFEQDFPTHKIPTTYSLDELKNLLADLQDQKREASITEQIRSIKEYKLYDEIQDVFESIEKKKYYDNPIMLEWNTWRAMTMLDGGEIKANLNFDDSGQPLSTASGNVADIVCDYGDFYVTVEVTMTSGQRQFETEGESVNRHLGKLRVASGKPCYCLFIAPTINDATISYFYILHHTHLQMYGGKSIIVPLPLKLFRKMVEDSYKADYIPNPAHIQSFFEASGVWAHQAKNEEEWYRKMTDRATNWLDNR